MIKFISDIHCISCNAVYVLINFTMKWKLSVFTLLALAVNVSWCAKILGLFPVNIKSHSIMINAILQELIARGHQVSSMRFVADFLCYFYATDYTARYCDELSIRQQYAQLYGY